MLMWTCLSLLSRKWVFEEKMLFSPPEVVKNSPGLDVESEILSSLATVLSEVAVRFDGSGIPIKTVDRSRRILDLHAETTQVVTTWSGLEKDAALLSFVGHKLPQERFDFDESGVVVKTEGNPVLVVALCRIVRELVENMLELEGVEPVLQEETLYFDDSEMVVETVDSTEVNVAEGPSPPEDIKESLELDVDTFSVRVVEDDSVGREESEMMLWSVNLSLSLVAVCPLSLSLVAVCPSLPGR